MLQSAITEEVRKLLHIIEIKNNAQSKSTIAGTPYDNLYEELIIHKDNVVLSYWIKKLMESVKWCVRSEKEGATIEVENGYKAIKRLHYMLKEEKILEGILIDEPLAKLVLSNFPQVLAVDWNCSIRLLNLITKDDRGNEVQVVDLYLMIKNIESGVPCGFGVKTTKELIKQLEENLHVDFWPVYA